MIKHGVMRYDPKARALVADSQGVQFTGLSLWVARFSDDWRGIYGSTWAIAFGRGPTYYYYPRRKEKHHA